MNLIVQAEVLEGRKIQWKGEEGIHPRAMLALRAWEDRDHLAQIESRVGRKLAVGQSVAVSIEVTDRWGVSYGQVELVESGLPLTEVSDLFSASEKHRKLRDLLTSVATHLEVCDWWDDGEPVTDTELRLVGYQCGCGWKVGFHTSLSVWAEHHAGTLPTGWTEKMMHLAIRGEYIAAVATGNHTTTQRVYDYNEIPLGILSKPMPRYGGVHDFSPEDFVELIPPELQEAHTIRMWVSSVGGVRPTNRVGDRDPYHTDITITAKVEGLDEQEAAKPEGQEGSSEPGPESDREQEGADGVIVIGSFRSRRRGASEAPSDS